MIKKLSEATIKQKAKASTKGLSSVNTVNDRLSNLCAYLKTKTKKIKTKDRENINKRCQASKFFAQIV